MQTHLSTGCPISGIIIHKCMLDIQFLEYRCFGLFLDI